MVAEDGSVTIEVAAELLNLDVRTIREWSAIGSLQIERRGDDDVVHLGHVKALARSPMGPGAGAETHPGALRELLREATVDTRGLAGLQELARARSTGDH